MQIFYRWQPVLPDADDDRIVEAAVRSRVNTLTFITPRQLLTAIGEP